MIVDFNDLDEEYVFIDVRTPKEYMDGSIGKCFNIPLFTNDEREKVGTKYKKSVEKAKMLAIEAVSEKLPSIYAEFVKIYKKHKKVALYCARGGMRSQTLGSLLNALGYDVKVINGGYKGYRNTVISETERFCKEVKFIVFHGNTGVAKTDIINGLDEKGIDNIDLEGLARHRGSILGKVGIHEEIPQKNFEHGVYIALKNVKSGAMIVEAESKRIGRNYLSDCFMEAMSRGDHVFIDAGIDFRTRFIVDEYIKSDEDVNEIIEVFKNFTKGLGLEKCNELIEMMKAGRYSEVAKFLMIHYYDPKYMHKSDTYEYKNKFYVSDVKTSVDEIYNWLKKDYNF
ncbi:tRNA 2-selenouridine(34) synthase MnmH [Helicovermis profundi]|uniref:tRNA 2-selenouridine(34) synthase MnmH n=1 Tax=Helicovermis profundi TaxID=3065157 RepID=A0AAU9E9T0_9FIRM|nr:tRNA 2-selenouridine(34) synthase MnmH [Clostridia bacterium S502]